ncbi:MAG: hypothetical protein F4X59_01310, partial [Holophagales bacterium]|nr:hypothetical protein [Holophagales bacterium]
MRGSAVRVRSGSARNTHVTRTQAGTLTADQVGRQTKVQGWVHRRRDHGGVIFLDVRDRSGVVQAVVHPETTPEAAEALQPARLEWVVEVEGKVVRRDPDKVNPKMATGEIEIQVAGGRGGGAGGGGGGGGGGG